MPKREESIEKLLLDFGFQKVLESFYYGDFRVNIYQDRISVLKRDVLGSKEKYFPLIDIYQDTMLFTFLSSLN
tara:strand:+ start:28 stop:246 length:219 start_codon:yes stop_codon:yes gene_type:complete